MRFKLSAVGAIPIACLIAAGLSAVALAQNEPADQGDAAAGSAANQPASTQPAADTDDADESGEVMRQLLEQRDSPPVQPEDEDEKPGGTGSTGSDESSQVDMPAVRADMDEATLGTAPGNAPGSTPGSGEDQTQLRREGDFIVSRRGHMVRSEKSGRLMFVFKGDGKESPEPPMVLQACRTLQNMEKIVEDRGQSVEFVLSGQVHTYRGRNYLLPTMMKLAENRGNLKE